MQAKGPFASAGFDCCAAATCCQQCCGNAVSALGCPGCRAKSSVLLCTPAPALAAAGFVL